LSVLSTVLVFAVIPAVCILVVALLVFAGSGRNRPSRRYRPGRPYDFQPVWFLASPERVSPELGGPSGRQAQQPAIESGVVENSQGERVLPGSTGGASDRW
jgi:hypothetical protein